MQPVDVARAALIEAGRPDLAVCVETNRAKWPMIKTYDHDDVPIITRAFWLAHISGGHDHAIILDGITCWECLGAS